VLQHQDTAFAGVRGLVAGWHPHANDRRNFPVEPRTLLPCRTSPLCCLCQVVVWGFFDAAGECPDRRRGAAFGCVSTGPAVALGRRVVTGPGVACPKSRRAGCELAALETEWFPGCPPGPWGLVAAAACRASATRAA